MSIDVWKKKIEEYFSQDKEAKCITIVESLRFSPPNLSNTIKQTQLGVALKENLL